MAVESVPPDPLVVSDTERVDRAATLVVTVVPVLALIFGIGQVAGNGLRWSDVVAFLVTYVLCGLGVTVGFHRLLTHRSFKTTPAVRGALAILGSAAVEGPVIEWVANHRKHHTFADHDGDPHSPHVDHGSGWRGALRGLWHAHLGWVFKPGVADPERYAPDLLRDRMIVFIDSAFLLWVLLGLAVPFAIGGLIGGSLGPRSAASSGAGRSGCSSCTT